MIVKAHKITRVYPPAKTSIITYETSKNWWRCWLTFVNEQAASECGETDEKTDSKVRKAGQAEWVYWKRQR